MDDDFKEKLKRKLESGEISEEIYSEIMSRWADVEKTRKDEETKEDDKEEKIDQNSLIRISGSGTLSEPKAHELRISGAGAINGKAVFDVAHISGSCKADSDLISKERIELSGMLRVEGDVISKIVDISGSLHGKSLTCESIQNSGSLKIEETLNSMKIDASGSLKANEIICKELESSGSLKAGSIEGDTVKIYGSIRSDKVKCRDFGLEILGGDSSVDVLEAENVNVIMKRKFLTSGRPAKFHMIRASKVDIENVKSEHVIADEAIIGDYCDIDLVEAKTIKISDKAEVREKKML